MIKLKRAGVDFVPEQELDGDNVIPDRDHRNPALERWQGKAKLGAAYKRAPKQEREKKLALRGGRAIPASGAKFRKGDVEVPNVARIECKATEAKSFSVTREMIRKIEEAAMLSNQIPYIEIEFVDAKGKVIDGASVISSSALTALINRLTEATEGAAPANRRDVEGFERRSRRFPKK